MARKKKGELPSGNVRVQVYDYTDDAGKKHYKSFTAPTRAQAQALATERKNNRRELKTALTVSGACEKYIEMKRNVLSPSTIAGYEASLRRIQKYSIRSVDLSVITNNDIQQFTSDLSLTLSSKSVRNTIGLITAAVNAFLPNFAVHVTLPAKTKPALYSVTTFDVQSLLNACETSELKLGILFAAIGTMRRGEACAVTFQDVDYSSRTIVINKSVVKSDTGEWITKTPKTYTSYRKIRMPQYVMDLIRTLDTGNRSTILGFTPSQLYDNFSSVRKKAGLPEFRYHDLRHYAASKMHAAGIPERYIEAIGGWKPGSNVLKRIYENVLTDEMTKFEESFAEKNRFCI